MGSAREADCTQGLSWKLFTYVRVVHKLHKNGESRCGKAH